MARREVLIGALASAYFFWLRKTSLRSQQGALKDNLAPIRPVLVRASDAAKLSCMTFGRWICPGRIAGKLPEWGKIAVHEKPGDIEVNWLKEVRMH